MSFSSSGKTLKRSRLKRRTSAYFKGRSYDRRKGFSPLVSKLNRMDRLPSVCLESPLSARLERLSSVRLKRLPLGRLERLPLARLKRLHLGRLERLPSARLERLTSARLKALHSARPKDALQLV